MGGMQVFRENCYKINNLSLIDPVMARGKNIVFCGGLRYNTGTQYFMKIYDFKGERNGICFVEGNSGAS